MHCAVPFFCARSGTEGEAAWRCGERVVRSAGNASRSRRAGVGAAWGSGSVRGGRVAVRGRAKGFGGECFAQPAGAVRDCVGVRRGCVGERKCSARACRCAGASGGLRRGMGCAVGGECIAQPAGVRRHCVGERKCSGRACAVRGRAEIFSGEWVVRAAGLTHIRRSSTHVYYYIYVRPVRAVKLQPWGRKTPSASTHRPRRLSHPPRLRLHFRARVHTSPASPSAAPAEQSASRSSSYPQWVIHGKVIHIVARRPVQNVLALAPAHAYI